MDDEQILDLYFAREEQALTETDRKYGSYCFALANNILHNEQDAEEIVSDTWWKTWNAIPPRRPTVFRMFLAKITRNLAFSRWRRETAGKRGGGEMTLVLEELGQCVASPETVEAGMEGKELAQTIRAFLDTLSARDQDIFLRRYFFVEESETIALRFGMKTATVRRTLTRIRGKLRKYLIQEGYTL